MGTAKANNLPNAGIDAGNQVAVSGAGTRNELTGILTVIIIIMIIIVIIIIIMWEMLGMQRAEDVLLQMQKAVISRHLHIARSFKICVK